jgi:PleD family two-component response regulator
MTRLDHITSLPREVRLETAVLFADVDGFSPRGTARVTLSIGVTLVTPRENADSVVDRADTGMYAAKRDGRNQVVVVPTDDGET